MPLLHSRPAWSREWPPRSWPAWREAEPPSAGPRLEESLASSTGTEPDGSSLVSTICSTSPLRASREARRGAGSHRPRGLDGRSAEGDWRARPPRSTPGPMELLPDQTSCFIGCIASRSSSTRTSTVTIGPSFTTASRRSCSTSDAYVILQRRAGAYRRMMQGVWDLVFSTSTYRPSPSRRPSVAPTPPVSAPDRPSLAHGGHDHGGYIWRR